MERTWERMRVMEEVIVRQLRVERTASKSSWAFSSANAFLTSLGSAFNLTDQEKSCLRMNQEQRERVFLAPDLNQALSWQLETHTPLVLYY